MAWAPPEFELLDPHSQPPNARAITTMPPTISQRAFLCWRASRLFFRLMDSALPSCLRSSCCRLPESEYSLSRPSVQIRSALPSRPAWKEALTESERWDVINYIRSLG